MKRALSTSAQISAIYSCGCPSLPSSVAFGVVMALLRIRNLFSSSVLPFTAKQYQPDEQPSEVASRISSELDREITNHGLEPDKSVCIFNLLKTNSDPSTAKGNNEYEQMMKKMFAECNAGPLHYGSAIVLEGSSDWDKVNTISPLSPPCALCLCPLR